MLCIQSCMQNSNQSWCCSRSEGHSLDSLSPQRWGSQAEVLFSEVGQYWSGSLLSSPISALSLLMFFCSYLKERVKISTASNKVDYISQERTSLGFYHTHSVRALLILPDLSPACSKPFFVVLQILPHKQFWCSLGSTLQWRQKSSCTPFWLRAIYIFMPSLLLATLLSYKGLHFCFQGR